MTAALHSAALRRDGLAPLWSALRSRFERGDGPVRRVRVGPLDREQQTALADLLGSARLPGQFAEVTVAAVDAALVPLGLDVRAALEAVGGPLQDQHAERVRGRSLRDALWTWLAEHPVVTAEPALRVWTEQVRSAGLVGGSAEATRTLLERALAVLAALPGGGEPLAVFAERHLHDSHALDANHRLPGLVLRAVAAIHDIEPPRDAAARRALWQLAGLECDALSATVLVAGLRIAGGGPLAATLSAWADAGQAVSVTLAQLRTAPPVLPMLPALPVSPALPVLSGEHVRIVENPSVLATAIDRHGAHCPPLVCTSGWPTTAAIELLRRLAAGGAKLWCHADLDGEGIRIAAHVIARTGARPWRMSAGDYLAAVPAQGGPPAGRVTEAPWDAELAGALRDRGVAVLEERVAGLLVDSPFPATATGSGIPG
jgi:uncharacterized protein (TIGR02679 family)